MSEPNFHYFLTGVSEVRDLVAGRIYPDMVRQGSALPAIVVSRTGGIRQQMLCGTDGLVRGSFQLDVYGKTRADVRELARRVIVAMLDYKGMMGTCVVKHCALSTDFDSVDPEPGLLRRTQLWDIWYVEQG